MDRAADAKVAVADNFHRDFRQQRQNYGHAYSV
jgi:hypothetical protein